MEKKNQEVMITFKGGRSVVYKGKNRVSMKDLKRGIKWIVFTVSDKKSIAILTIEEKFDEKET